MPSGHGRIVNVASITAFIGMTHLLDYVSSKGAVIVVHAGARPRDRPGGRHRERDLAGRVPDRRGEDPPGPGGVQPVDSRPAEPQARGTPEDIGNLVVFLATDASSFVTGQVIEIDGGWYMH